MPAILGTAGHIDHGKTALVRALTGQDTDRLKEEKERGISIDLGFAWLDLADGSRAGIVDVPGHERFIRNMLAGAHGIDVVLLVVAADDGVMPQTEEHLEIIHLLGVERGIAVVTKADLVAPPRLREVEQEIAALLAGTRLAGAPAVAVSSVTGAGLDELRREIERQLAAAAVRSRAGAFRLPVDRAFVLRGHGVVVTGTATSGIVREGDAVRLLPGGEEGRVRSIQVHGSRVAEATSGQRVAINLGGIERTDVRRGHLLADPRFHRTTTRLDAVLEIRPGAGRAVKNLAVVRLHHGTASAPARLHLLDGRSELRPKERGFVQLVLEEELAVVLGDRFVLRDETARRTLGGGVVLQPLAQRHRRGDGTVERLAAIEGAPDLGSRLAALLHAGDALATELDALAEAVPETSQEVLAALRGNPEIALLPPGEAAEVAITAAAVARLEAAVLAHLGDAHRRQPQAPGAEMESVRSAVAPELRAKLFRALVDGLARRSALMREDSVLRLPTHRAQLAAPERALAERVERSLASGGLAPPDVKQLEAEFQIAPRRLTEILAQLEREGRVARVAPDLYYAAPALQRARELLEAHLRQHGQISAAIFRDLIRGSRKFSIALLDYFDRIGFTLRVGDLRKLRRGGA